MAFFTFFYNASPFFASAYNRLEEISLILGNLKPKTSERAENSMKIAILGRKKDTANYERFVRLLPAIPVTTLNPAALSECSALLLPGGGDISPAFFGERNNGSKNIDTELDILQFQAFNYAVQQKLPILGICKGMQVINVALGGTITQNLPTAQIHQYTGKDQYHNTTIMEGSCLYRLYGGEALVNSAHHQGVKRIGNGLFPIQWCSMDHCVEAIAHETLPILGLQWHPERISPEFSPLFGEEILSLISFWAGHGCA